MEIFHVAACKKNRISLFAQLVIKIEKIQSVDIKA